MAEITAVNPQTGERITLVNGRWEKAGPSTPRDDNSREVTLLNAERERLRVARDLARLGRSFHDANAQNGGGTGGIGSYLGSGWGFIPQLDQREQRRRMEGLTAEMSAAARIPGSGDMSEKEMMMNMQRFPNVLTQGPVNDQRVNALIANEEAQRNRVAAMERWLADHHGTLTGFEEQWAPQEQRLRARRPPAYGGLGRRPAARHSADGVIDLGAVK